MPVTVTSKGRRTWSSTRPTAVEPPAGDDPILTTDNAVILPHIGSATVETRAAMLELAVANFVAAMGGQTPPECVNPEILERALTRR